MVISESHVLRQFLDALERDLHAPAALERERLGDHRHGQDAQLLGQLRDHRRGAGAGAAAHAGGDEHHVGAVERLADALAVLERGLAADFGIGAGAQALGDVAAELQHAAWRRGCLERLRVGVGADELDAVDAGADHVGDGVAAAAADADDLDDRVGCEPFDQFEHFPSSVVLHSYAVLIYASDLSRPDRPANRPPVAA